jgi:flavin reductase (DIM6/NTAB) family NADH-FMN oxidoreductase RutF
VTEFDVTSLSGADANALATGLIGPRPIAWVSTVAPDGAPNLAPFSYFNAFSHKPLTIAIGPGSRRGVHKDSLRNIKETGEFVISVVTEELAARANLTSAEFERDVNEWAVAGVTPAASRDIRPPRVAESPASFECRVFQIVDLGPPEVPTNSVVVARVSRIHVRDDVLDGVVPDPGALRLVGRMGGSSWCTTRDRFELARPTPAEALAAAEQEQQ